MKRGKIAWKRVAILLAVLAGLFGLTGLAVYVFGRPLLATLRSQAWEHNPSLAATTAEAMIDFDLPPGYQAVKVLNVQQNTPGAVLIASQEWPSDMILISKVPDGILGNETWRTSYEDRRTGEIGDQFYDTQTVSTETDIIRGQPTTLRFFEGTDKNGQSVKQLACMFTGKNGDILLVVVASQATWDQTLVEDFLHSIR